MAEQRLDSAEELHRFSCVLCHKRKVKCDRQEPCGYCTRHGDDCRYETPPPPKRRKKEHKSDHSDLLARLQRAEDQLRLSGLMPAGQPDIHSPVPTDSTSISAPTPTQVGESVEPERTHPMVTGRLIARGGHSRYLANNLYHTLNQELENPLELLQQSGPGDYVTGDFGSDGDEMVDNEGSSMLLGTGHLSDQALVELFPTPAQQSVLWQVYLDNVHYLTMILHRPTFQRVVDAARINGILSLPKSSIALLFSTYFHAVASLNNAQCETKLREPRRKLLRQLRLGTRQALVKARFVNSTDLVCLQALVQYLLCMRHGYDSQTLWVLSGAAFRIAQALGIHREDAEASLTPFECEMRRRLWRQLLILDFTSSELAGSAPGYTVMLGLDADSRVPLNVNDDDLYEDMKELPQDRYGATDMIFCRLRYEFGSFFLFLSKPRRMQPEHITDTPFHRLTNREVPVAEKDQYINDLENKLQTQYLRFCDPINRLHTLTTVAARAAMTGMRLRAHHPRQYADGGKNLPQEEKDMLFSLSTRIIKYDVHCHSQKELQGYLWHIRVYFQWHAVIYFLNELRHRAIDSTIEESWELVQEMFHYHPEIMADSNFALYRAIRVVTLRAWDARETALRKHGMQVVVPDIIFKIRQRVGIQPKTGKEEQQNEGFVAPASTSATDGAMYHQFTTPSSMSEAVMAENRARGEPALPYSVGWPQAVQSDGSSLTPDGSLELKPGEPSPIDWDAWDSLVHNIDLPQFQFGLEAFFK